jgi:uncharacterized membrane protein
MKRPSSIPASKLPLPVAATDFRFLTSPSLPTVAILEVDTEGNPVRIAFEREQLQRLAQLATISAAKLLLHGP